MIARFQSAASAIREMRALGTCLRTTVCEASRRATPIIRATMLAARANVTLPNIKEQSGDGCSAHLFLRICVRTTTQPERLRFSSRLQIMCVSYGLGTAGEIFDGNAPFAPRGASPRLGRLVNFCALGRPQPLRQRVTRRH
jgi:hypothetical protein